MILVIDALNKDMFQDVLVDMFQLRARVFGDRLGWEVNIQNGQERDQFDDLDPGYVIGIDKEGHVVSCARFLQTTGPHMLSDVFQAILCGEPPLRSATIWESTRFCVDTNRLSSDDKGSSNVSQATTVLMVAMMEYAKKSGITDIITVIDPIMNRVMKRSANAPYDYVGKLTDMGKVPAMAALIDCTDERIARVRAFAGINGDVFLTDEQARKLINRKPKVGLRLVKSDVSPNEIVAYCNAQLAAARNDIERQAAERLITHLIDKGMYPAH